VHPHAENAAEAAEAAGAQNKFWEMHNTIFENQRRLRPRDLALYAESLGLDVGQFSDDLTRHAYHDRIQDDFISGVRSGVNGTPCFFLNGLRHDGPADVDTLVNALERSLVFR
jgi:protein-disulfide isomerase